MVIEKLNQNKNLTEMDVVKEKTQSDLLDLKENVVSSKEKDRPMTLKELKEVIARMLPDVAGGLAVQVLNKVEKLKNSIGIKGWKQAESLVDDLGNDLDDLLDEKTDSLYLKFWFILFGQYGADGTYNELWKDKETKEEAINFIEKFCKIVAKYFGRISRMFSKGLKDNFKDVPEPMKSHFIKNKDKIGKLEKSLSRYAGSIDKIGQTFISMIIQDKFSYENLKKQSDALLAGAPSSLSDIFSDLGTVFDVEQVIDDITRVNVGPVERDIRRTNEHLNWWGERGNVSYDYLHKKIISWGNEVEMENFNLNSVKLQGLDIELSFQQGIWLANFKNWKNKKYGNKKVKFKMDLINRNFDFDKTLVVDGTMLITREELEKYIPMCSNDEVMEKIAEWLNK